MGEDPDPEQLAQACGVSTGKIVRLLQSSQEPLSLDMMVGDEENAALGSFLSDSTVSNPEEMILKLEFQTEVEEIFASLSERERMIIRRRLGLDSTESNVLQDIGTDLQLSRERIRQIEASAIKKLRTLANRRRLRDKYVS
jgi:RNA polymerase primary sigma factor